jgi:hypothetical protein
LGWWLLASITGLDRKSDMAMKTALIIGASRGLAPGLAKSPCIVRRLKLVCHRG